MEGKMMRRLGFVLGALFLFVALTSPAFADDTYEPNNTFQTAYGPLLSGASIVSYISTVNDVDYYCFYASRSSAVNIVLQTPSGLAPSSYYTYGVYLLDVDPGLTGSPPAWWNSLASKQAQDGQEVVIDYTLQRAGFYRIAVGNFNDLYSGSLPYTLSLSGPSVTLPPPTVYTPHAPSTMSHSKYYTVYGYLKPRHTAGSDPLRIYRYRYVSGRWKSYGYVSAKASNYSNYTKCSAKVKLGLRGRWRLRAYAPADSGHSAKWSSGYDYVTVK
jgi:hypothetical protein